MPTKIKESWEKKFDRMFDFENQGCSQCGGYELVDKTLERYPKSKYHCEYDLEKVKDFIRSGRIEAKREERERIALELIKITKMARPDEVHCTCLGYAINKLFGKDEDETLDQIASRIESSLGDKK